MAATVERGTLTADEARITSWLAEQKPAMLRLLEEVVNIDSGSYDKAGVDAVGELLVDRHPEPDDEVGAHALTDRSQHPPAERHPAIEVTAVLVVTVVRRG